MNPKCLVDVILCAWPPSYMKSLARKQYPNAVIGTRYLNAVIWLVRDKKKSNWDVPQTGNFKKLVGRHGYVHGLFVKSVLLTKDHLCQSTLCVGNSERKVKFQGFNSLLFSWVRGLGNILTQIVEIFQTMTLHQYLKSHFSDH